MNYSHSAGFAKLKKYELFENVIFGTPLFCNELPISQNRDGQPTIKFYKQRDAWSIYRLIPRHKRVYAVCGRERSEKPSK
jgi:hypothetical protein